MKRLTGTILLVFLLPLVAAAQGSDYSKGHGYVYFAPGASSAHGAKTIHIGAGGEAFFIRNLGLGADVGYLTPFESFKAKDGVGTFSPSIVVRFPSKRGEGKAEPFASVGYTLFFRSGTESGVNFGGGVNYWFKDRVGLRFELRDNVWIPGADGRSVHYVGLRIGLTFR